MDNTEDCGKLWEHWRMCAHGHVVGLEHAQSNQIRWLERQLHVLNSTNDSDCEG